MISSDGIRGYNDMIILRLILEEPSYGYEISKAIKEKRLRPLAKMFGMIASVAVFMLISLVPCLVYQFRNGSLLTSRSVLDSELYAMKIPFSSGS